MRSFAILSFLFAISAALASVIRLAACFKISPPGPVSPKTYNSCIGWYLAGPKEVAQMILDKYPNVTMQYLAAWNPVLTQLDPDIMHDVDASLIAGNAYCIGIDPSIPPGPHAPDTTKECSQWRLIGQGWMDCAFLWRTSGVTMEEFYDWNPSAQSKGCTVGNAYCVNVKLS